MREKSREDYHIIITSKHNCFDFKLKEVYKYRDLIWLFTKKSFVLKYKQTILGPAWLFLNPVITSLIYCFIFGGVANISTGTIPQLLFYMSGNAMWTYFSTCLVQNASVFTDNANLFGKVYFPRLTIPISNMISAFLQFCIQMIIVLGLLVYYFLRGAVSPNLISMLLIPLVLLHLGIMAIGCGIIISSLTTKYRDLSILVTFGVSLWMYITPVVYPLSQASSTLLRNILLLNPVTSPMEVFRYALLGEGTIHPIFLIWSLVFSLIVLTLGMMIFNKVEKTFMDTV